MTRPVIAIHGGAGAMRRITMRKQGAYLAGLGGALDAGYRVLEEGGSCLDAPCRGSFYRVARIYARGEEMVFRVMKQRRRFR
ncbi:MAG: isoaspartyl peptidase/L-asparaginase [Betaproteobacteria bacterium]|nr:isoaspartyl peptidase/L-asparaginase [Betaproteobacteria bacterium]